MRIKRMFGWLGSICLLLIIPIKLIRIVDQGVAATTVIRVAPSILGPLGLLFLILSSSGKLSKLTLLQTTLLVAGIALMLEFAQLLPRPGFLQNIHYTFDWLDVVASLLSIYAGYFIACLISKENDNTNNGGL